LGNNDQGDSGAPPGGAAEALPLGVGEEEKWSSRPGLFQLALDVPGVGEEVEVEAEAWCEEEEEEVEGTPMMESPLCSNSISRLVRAIDWTKRSRLAGLGFAVF